MRPEGSIERIYKSEKEILKTSISRREGGIMYRRALWSRNSALTSLKLNVSLFPESAGMDSVLFVVDVKKNGSKMREQFAGFIHWDRKKVLSTFSPFEFQYE